MTNLESLHNAIAVIEDNKRVIANLKTAATVLLDTIKRGDDPTAAMYQLEQLL